MKLALPYLEGLSYVERYAWFEPLSGVADYYNSSGTLTPVGIYYKNLESTPSIPESILYGRNNITFHNGIPTASPVKPDIIIYPNPVTDVLNISSTTPIDELSILNIRGTVQMVFNKQKEILNVSKLSPGIYFIQADHQVLRFIKL